MNTSDNNDKTKNEPAKKERSVFNSLVVGGLGVVSGLYLMFPASKAIQVAIELVPVVGQFDEVAAAAILFSCLSYFGLDLTGFFGKAKEYDRRTDKKAGSAKTVDAKVV